MSAGTCEFSVVVSAFAFGKPVEQAVRDLQAIAPAGSEVLVAAEGANRASALNRAVESTGGRALLFVPSFVDVTPQLFADYLRRLEQLPDAGLIYGDYDIVVEPGRAVRRAVLADEADLSEWSSTGYMTLVRRSALADVGGFDPSYTLAEEYELRLRLSRRWALARVPEVRYRLNSDRVPLGDPEVRTSLRRYFTPESSAKRGYGYLFERPEAAREVERAFATELRARGAYLERRPAAVRCPHQGARPTVSVIVPVYNRAAFLRRALDSVLGGTFTDLEIVVVDGGSTDGTLDVITEYQRRVTGLWLVRNPRRVVGASLNLGLGAARGKYVAQLDSDDEFTSGTLARCVDYLEAHPDCALAISYYDFIDAEGRTLEDLGIITHLEYDRNAILRTNGAGAVRVWHRCILERLGGFDERRFPDYAEDYDMILRLSERYAVGRVPEVLYRCRKHDSNSEQCLSLEARAGRKALARRLALERRMRLNRLVELPGCAAHA